MSKKTVYYLLAIAVVVIGVLLFLAKKGIIGNKDDGKEVEITTVSHNTIVQTVSATGKIQPEIEVKIAVENEMKTLFKGVIKSLDKHIENSQIVAKIECKDVALRLAQSSTEAENNNQTFEDKLTLFTNNLLLSDNLVGQDWGQEHITHNNTNHCE